MIICNVFRVYNKKYVDLFFIIFLTSKPNFLCRLITLLLNSKTSQLRFSKSELVKNKLDITFANEQEIMSLIDVKKFDDVINFAKEINKLLDQMLTIRGEIARMRADLDANANLVNNQTGEKVTANKIEELANNEINAIKNELNKVTNEGKRATGIFNNVYYVNDVIQDKLLVEGGYIIEDADNE